MASLRAPCKHAPNGCRKMLKVTNRKQHELYECEFLLLDCPFPGCRFTSCLHKYSSHVQHMHNGVRVIPHNSDEELLTFGDFHLDSRDEFVVLKACPELFLLHQEDTALGHMLYISSCGKDKKYSLKVVISNEYEKGPKTFNVEITTSSENFTLARFFVDSQAACSFVASSREREMHNFHPSGLAFETSHRSTSHRNVVHEV